MNAQIKRLAAGLERGERRALGRLLSLIENGEPEELRAVVAEIHPCSGHARILGVTGSPGVGKSTVTNAMTTELRSRERSIAVLAVDPSSPFSGGALLGDRVRMQRHHADTEVFIRSMASRGHLGGLAFTTPQAILAMDAAGFDDIIVETVGVGQSEVEIAATADTTIVALAPGMGDAIQAAKAGILEVADVLVINKSDQAGAGQLASQLRGMLEMGHGTRSPAAEAGWIPPIVQTVGVRGEGIGDLLSAVDEHENFLATSGLWKERRRKRDVHAIREIALASVRGHLRHLNEGGSPLLASLARRVETRELDPYEAAEELLAAFRDAG